MTAWEGLPLKSYSAGAYQVWANGAKKSCKSWKDRYPLATQAVNKPGIDGYHAA